MSINVEEYYKLYAPMVLRRCRWLLRDREMARDAMQDVFVLLLRNQDRLKGEYPSSLLYRMATNVCLNIIRSRKRHPETKDEELLLRIASQEDVHAKSEAKDTLDWIFSQEKDSTKTIAVLYHIDGLTLEQVAQEVGMSVSGVRKRLRILREKLSDYPDLKEA